jgi:hypothetical protein
MAGGFSGEKGKRAEREVVKLLQPVVNRVCEKLGREPPLLERNLMQSHRGGHDIVGLEWIAIEVKHHETLQVNQWWEQTKRQAGAEREAVLLFKQNRIKWSVLLFGYLDSGQSRVRCPCQVSLEAFLVWFEIRLTSELMK